MLNKPLIFQGIDENEKKNLLNSLQSTQVIFTKNKTIASYVNNSNLIGIIEEGQIDLVRYDYNGDRTIIEHLNQGDIFSDIFYQMDNNETSLIATTTSKILFINYDDIIKNPNKNTNKLIENLFNIFKDKIIEQTIRIEILTKRSIREKLLAYFNKLSKENMSKSFNLPFTYSFLADYLSINRSAMAREIKALKDDGLIKEINKKITLLY